MWGRGIGHRTLCNQNQLEKGLSNKGRPLYGRKTMLKGTMCNETQPHNIPSVMSHKRSLDTVRLSRRRAAAVWMPVSACRASASFASCFSTACCWSRLCRRRRTLISAGPHGADPLSPFTHPMQLVGFYEHDGKHSKHGWGVMPLNTHGTLPAGTPSAASAS